MKKIITVLLGILIFVGFSSCEKLKEEVNKAVEFDMNYASETTVPSSSIAASQVLEINTPEIATESSSRFGSEGTSSSLISEIKFKKLTISNSNGNLDFLDSLSIYIQSPGQPGELVASKLIVPKSVSSFECDLTDLNVKEYLFKEKIQFKVVARVTSGGVSAGDQKLKLEEILHVKGKLL
ncbi:hypothetical protein [Aurantibacillus circumpalustris]|uniref:hypothetical protein n=1 Tax=Aurantibacillus circumpalustris TaxID=3036359 RepID=UPI00295B3729|nr:hypothetical protein [Aurantibacillus circumpalustris]